VQKGFFGLLAGVVICAANVNAATVTVGITNDSGYDNIGRLSLRQAIINAQPGDTIVFSIPTTDPGYDPSTSTWTITLFTGELFIYTDLTIDGGGQKITVRRSTVSGTPAFRIFNIASGTVTLSGLTIADGSAGAPGGGGIRNAGALTVRSCTLNGNDAIGSNGGGILNLANASASVINSTIYFNVASLGGGIYNAGSLAVESSTFSQNAAFCCGGAGGGIHNENGATAHVGNTVFTNNHSGPSVGLQDVAGAFISDGYNLVRYVGFGSSGFGIAGSHDQVGVDPMLSGLQDNGGPTQTISPLFGSPCIDQGSSGGLMTDQRGLPRPSNDPTIPDADDGSDIGAVEVANLIVTNNNDSGAGSLRDVLANAPPFSNIFFAANVVGSINLTSAALSINKSVAIKGPGADVLALSGAGANRVFNVANNVGFAVTNLTIRDAVASSGDGGAVRSPGSGTTLTFIGCKFLNNKCADGASGSAIYSFGPLNLTNCEIGLNSGGGGAVKPRSGAAVTKINGCDFHGNQSVGTGGGGYGGAMQIFDGPTVTIESSTFRNNTAAVDGGSIYMLNASVTLTGCTLTDNGAHEGGGIFVPAGSTLTVSASTIATNSAGIGGGISNAGTATLTNTTLSGNTAFGAITVMTGYGGAIYNSGSLTITNVTLSDNAANFGDHPEILATGGIYNSNPGTVSLTNTLLAKGAKGANCSEHFGGNSNLSDDGTCGFTFDSFTRDNVPPLLGPLANNGGPTQTHLPLPGSPAIDHGTNSGAPATDQRGVHRSQGSGFDVGAVEVAPNDVPKLANISTRLRVETGDNVLIGGFIVTGTQDKKVIVRAIGPSLPVADALADPFLELHDGASNLIASNDNWKDTQQAEIQASGLAPTNDLESAIVITLPANTAHYTAIVRGVNDTTGVGLVEVYDLDRSVDSKLANISTRGFVQSGDNVMIGGVIALGRSPLSVIIRAIGPSLVSAGVGNALPDPTLELYDGNGTLLAFNDNWKDSQQAEIQATGVPPTNDLESAIVATLNPYPATYTAIVRGVNDTTGVALVEVYGLQ
jgi:predicted outer membrane repeat protein